MDLTYSLPLPLADSFFFFFAPVGGLLLTANLVYSKEAKNVPRRLDTRDTFFAYASQVLSDFLSYLISLHRQCFLCACNRSLAHVRPSLGASMLVLGVAVTDWLSVSPQGAAAVLFMQICRRIHSQFSSTSEPSPNPGALTAPSTLHKCGYRILLENCELHCCKEAKRPADGSPFHTNQSFK